MSVVYCCDHEPYARALASGQGEITGQDLRHAQFIKGADLLIHDAQYTADEYRSKVGWGHSSIEYALHLSQTAGVRRLAFTHHDPLRHDEALDRLLEKARRLNRGSRLEVFAAAEGQVFELKELPAAGREAHPRVTATATVEKFLSGDGEDLHTVALATQEADLAFEMFQQVRNKVVNAYQEIMKMQM